MWLYDKDRIAVLVGTIDLKPWVGVACHGNNEKNHYAP
jgi:hypothetical protein